MMCHLHSDLEESTYVNDCQVLGQSNMIDLDKSMPVDCSSAVLQTLRMESLAMLIRVH